MGANRLVKCRSPGPFPQQPQPALQTMSPQENMMQARLAPVPPAAFATNPSPESVLALLNRVLERVRVQEDLFHIRDNALHNREADHVAAGIMGPLEAAHQRGRELDDREQYLIECEATLVQQSHNLRVSEQALRDREKRLTIWERRLREAEMVLLRRAKQWKHYSHQLMAISRAAKAGPGGAASEQGAKTPAQDTSTRQRKHSHTHSNGGSITTFPTMPATPILIDLTTPPSSPHTQAMDVDDAGPSRPQTAPGNAQRDANPAAAGGTPSQPSNQPASPVSQSKPERRYHSADHTRGTVHETSHINIPHPTSWIMHNAGGQPQARTLSAPLLASTGPAQHASMQAQQASTPAQQTSMPEPKQSVPAPQHSMPPPGASRPEFLQLLSSHSHPRSRTPPPTGGTPSQSVSAFVGRPPAHNAQMQVQAGLRSSEAYSHPVEPIRKNTHTHEAATTRLEHLLKLAYGSKLISCSTSSRCSNVDNCNGCIILGTAAIFAAANIACSSDLSSASDLPSTSHVTCTSHVASIPLVTSAALVTPAALITSTSHVALAAIFREDDGAGVEAENADKAAVKEESSDMEIDELADDGSDPAPMQVDGRANITGGSGENQHDAHAARQLPESSPVLPTRLSNETPMQKSVDDATFMPPPPISAAGPVFPTAQQPATSNAPQGAPKPAALDLSRTVAPATSKAAGSPTTPKGTAASSAPPKKMAFPFKKKPPPSPTSGTTIAATWAHNPADLRPASASVAATTSVSSASKPASPSKPSYATSQLAATKSASESSRGPASSPSATHPAKYATSSTTPYTPARKPMFTSKPASASKPMFTRSAQPPSTSSVSTQDAATRKEEPEQGLSFRHLQVVMKLEDDGTWKCRLCSSIGKSKRFGKHT
ncbi:hypothetical protein BD626DRAFT_575047 [Schizophyllum amplum]|uniref:Uncharacterized protein n=1 Tax=Schizophyllum amplum TaxID=97359 RepID=A0A550BWN9_9AGAR|nr:hypothetical protein BD626DRAFT_575047 [Auriculariopsis ampla]